MTNGGISYAACEVINITHTSITSSINSSS